MIRFMSWATAAALLSAPAFAQGVHVFDNPCERGPIPTWNTINYSRSQFIDFIQEVRPGMPRDLASVIAHQVCDDITIVGNSDALTARLRVLLREYGY